MLRDFGTGETLRRSPTFLLNHLVAKSELFIIYMGGSRDLYKEFCVQ